MEQRVRERTAELQETNSALRVMLKRRDREKIELAEDIQSEIIKQIKPYLEKITYYQQEEKSI